MKPSTVWSCALSLALTCLASAQAAGVWRCGPDGRSYSDVPCPEGRQIEAPAARPQQDMQEAQAVADREKRLAESLRQERLQREAVLPGAGLAGIGNTRPDPVKSVAKKGPQKRHRLARHSASDETWSAVVPASRRKPD